MDDASPFASARVCGLAHLYSRTPPAAWISRQPGAYFFAGRLRAAEYAGPLTLEVQAGEAYEGRMDADAFLARAYAAAARLRGLLDGEGPGRLGLG